MSSVQSCFVPCICYSLCSIIQIPDFLAFVFSRMLTWISTEESNYISKPSCLRYFLFLCFMNIYMTNKACCWYFFEWDWLDTMLPLHYIMQKKPTYFFLSFFFWTAAIIQLMSNHPIILMIFRDCDFTISGTKDQWLNLLRIRLQVLNYFEAPRESNVQTDIEVDCLSGDAQSWKDFGQMLLSATFDI